MVAPAWDTLFVIGGELEDTILFLPRKLAAGGQRLYAFDYHDHRLKAFDADGALLWQFGGRGRGPGEFEGLFDLKVGPEGDIWVLDPDVGRVTAISPEGELTRMILLGGILGKDLIPRSEGLLVTEISQDHFWAELNMEGDLVHRAAVPPDGLRSVDPQMRQPLSASIRSGELMSMTFPFGDRVMVYRGRRMVCSANLIEGEGFPHSGIEPTVWVVAVAMNEESIFILARGTTPAALTIIDEYSASDCGYRRTLRLPGRFRTMTYADGVFYLQHETPAPTIVALRPLPESH